MKNQTIKKIYPALIFFVAFILWTLLICFVDVADIGPEETAVGFSTLNERFNSITGVNLSLYYVTDWFSVIPIGFVIGFAVLGLLQWIKRKNIMRVDFDILILGGFYIIVFAIYGLFEIFVVNYRPILIEGCLEASYPSSTTLLVMCVMPTVIMQFNARVKSITIKKIFSCVIIAFIIFMVFARLVSGVHWLTDIIGGILLSFGLICMYRALCERK